MQTKTGIVLKVVAVSDNGNNLVVENNYGGFFKVRTPENFEKEKFIEALMENEDVLVVLDHNSFSQRVIYAEAI
jgi:hypothetical protein